MTDTAPTGAAPLSAALRDLSALANSIACTDEVCITCSDEGRLGEVITPPAGQFLPALVRTERGEEEVDVTLVGEVVPGDLILIHAGGAIARIPEPTEGAR